MPNDAQKEEDSPRKNECGIQPQFLGRWSSRSFLDEEIPEAELMGVLEAAHWAPSCFNAQPWRFIIARRGADKAALTPCLAASNQVWAEHAPVLIVILARTEFLESGKPNRWHAFDTGCAWGYLALEAYARGLVAHAMGGFSETRVRKLYRVPEGWAILTVVALGKRGPKETLPEELQQREKPSERISLASLCREAKFDF